MNSQQPTKELKRGIRWELWAPLGVGIGALSVWLTWNCVIAPTPLSYTVSKPQSLLNIQTYGQNRLELSLNGVVVKEPFITEVHFENTGSKPIRAEDFTDKFRDSGRGLQVQANNKDCKILACDVNSMKPSNRAPIEVSIIQSESNDNKSLISPAIHIVPVALNQSESFNIRMITDNSPGTINVVGHITDCRIQAIEGNEFLGPLFENAVKGLQFLGLGIAYTAGVVFISIPLILYYLGRWLWSSAKPWIFQARVENEVKTADEAKAILVSDSSFQKLCDKLKVDGASQREQLRKELSTIAEKVTIDVQEAESPEVPMPDLSETMSSTSPVNEEANNQKNSPAAESDNSVKTPPE